MRQIHEISKEFVRVVPKSGPSRSKYDKGPLWDLTVDFFPPHKIMFGQGVRSAIVWRVPRRRIVVVGIVDDYGWNPEGFFRMNTYTTDSSFYQVMKTVFQKLWFRNDLIWRLVDENEISGLLSFCGNNAHPHV